MRCDGMVSGFSRLLDFREKYRQENWMCLCARPRQDHISELCVQTSGRTGMRVMWSIQKDLSQNIPIQDCISSATLTNVSRHILAGEKIQDKLAFLINEFQSQMVTLMFIFRSGRRNRRTQNPFTKQKVFIDVFSTSSQDWKALYSGFTLDEW